MTRPNRLEAKYLIHRTTRTALARTLEPFMRRDPHASDPDGSYMLQSLYFDSPTRVAYYEKLDGVPRRTKLRLRVYDPAASPDSPVFVEIKYKVGDTVFKRRTPITREECLASLDQPFFWPPRLDDPVLREYTRLARARGMRPAILVRYRRQALSARHDPSVRVTFDDQVEALRTDDLFSLEHSPFSALPAEHAILEIKVSGKMPWWLHRAILRHGLDRRAISKFLLCVRAAAQTTFKLETAHGLLHELD